MGAYGRGLWQLLGSVLPEINPFSIATIIQFEVGSRDYTPKERGLFGGKERVTHTGL